MFCKATNRIDISHIHIWKSSWKRGSDDVRCIWILCGELIHVKSNVAGAPDSFDLSRIHVFLWYPSKIIITKRSLFLTWTSCQESSPLNVTIHKISVSGTTLVNFLRNLVCRIVYFLIYSKRRFRTCFPEWILLNSYFF